MVCLHLLCAGTGVDSRAKERRVSGKIKHSKIRQSRGHLGSLNSAVLHKFLLSPALMTGEVLLLINMSY